MARLDPAPLLPGLQRLAGRLLEGIEPPPVALLRQRLDPPVVADVAAAVAAEVRRALAGMPPRKVAVGVGSRGIAGIGAVVGEVVETLRQLGFDPFVVPAMGSHGAATALGQAELLAGYGIDPALILPTMETEVVGEVDGVPVHVDRHVVEAGAAFLV